MILFIRGLCLTKKRSESCRSGQLSRAGLRPDAVIYSGGVGEDITFEQELIDEGLGLRSTYSILPRSLPVRSPGRILTTSSLSL